MTFSSTSEGWISIPLNAKSHAKPGSAQKSFGYRSRQRLKPDILFHLGGLNMAPLAVQ
jgi:hypothetical protein